MIYSKGRRKLVDIMALEDESSQDCESQVSNEEHSDGEGIMERQQFLQESLTDIERVCSIENQECGSDEGVAGELQDESKCDNVDPQEGSSGIGQNSSRSYDKVQNSWPLRENVGSQIQENVTDHEQAGNVARLERYGNYLEKYGPQLERYGYQLEQFGSQLERIGPHLERCGSNLERYGPQLEAIGRHLVRSPPQQVNSNLPEERPRNQQNGNMSLQTQTESGNEGFAPQSADSCQGSSASSSGRQGQWINSPNPRRLSRRPSFQVNDGLVRHWMRRRNIDSRDLIPFNRFREDRRRSIWRNDGDLRDFRRQRTSQWRYHDNHLFNRQQADNVRENNESDDNGPMRIGRIQLNQQQENGGLLQQDHVRIPRNESLHQDDPDYGFVLVDDHNSPGPSRPDTSSARRPRSHMSLRPLNVFNPPILGPIAEYNAESDEDNNDQRPDVFGRRAIREREGNVIRSWVMMNNYFQTRPLFIGQGDSKAVDGQFTVQRIPQDDHFYNGNERNMDIARVPRPIARNQRAERRQQRQQLAFQQLA